MSATSFVPLEPSAWPLRVRQLREVVWLEVRRGLPWLRLLPLLFVAFAPVTVIALHAYATRRIECVVAQETMILGGIVQLFYVRVGLFFGCMGVFLRLVSGEVAERTLHYPFLAPVRREVLLVGKFLAAAIGTIGVFSVAVTLAFTLVYAHFGAGPAFVWEGPGLAHLRAYLLVTALTCLGYGAVFLALSLMFRNAVIPAMVWFVWEGMNGALPASLKPLSVTHWVKPLFPVELPLEGFVALFTVVAEPLARWQAVGGMLVFTAVALAFSCWRIRRVEVSYTE